jgi:glucose-1-phosphate thymidylyltransferase
MKIVIPMAGLGTRLRPHTWSKPKPLVSVAGQPVLGHVLQMFGSLTAIEEVVFIVGYLGEQIQSFMDEEYPEIKASYVVQEEMKGQSHAIWLARERLEGPVYLAFVDTIIEADLSIHQDTGAQAIAWVKEVDDPRRFGVADVDKTGRVLRLIEKPADPNIILALAGFYYFPQAIDLVAAFEEQMASGTQLGGEYYLADAINIMIEAGLDLRTRRVDVWMDCGKPDALLETNRYLLDHGRDNSRYVENRPGSVFVPPVFIHPGTEIRDSVIGPYVSIGPNCVIQDSEIRDTVIEREAVVRDSVLHASLVGVAARLRGAHGSVNLGDHSEIDLGDAPLQGER